MDLPTKREELYSGGQVHELRSWFLREKGADYLQVAETIASKWLADTRGDFALELCAFFRENLLAERSQVRHLFSLGFQGRDIRCNLASLPIGSDSVDLVVACHVVEFSPEPYAILREVVRTLAPGGIFFLVAFNPFSMLGLQKILRRSRGAPWCGHYYSQRAISVWLRLLGLKILRARGLCLPRGEHLIGRLGCNFLADWIGKCGGIYVIKAKKEVFGAKLNLKIQKANVFIGNRKLLQQPTASCANWK